MKTKYTIEELRGLGFETVGDEVIFGELSGRVAVRAVAGEVVLDDQTFPGALIRAKMVTNKPPPKRAADPS